FDEAITTYRGAIRLKPEYAEAHWNLGSVLHSQGDVPGAIVEFRKAIDLQPDLGAEAHNALGIVLHAHGDLPGAIVEFRKAIARKPGYADAYCNLGHALKRTGHFSAALEAMKRGQDLGSRNPKWAYLSRSARWVQDCQRLIDLDSKLPGVLHGE